MKIKKKSGGGVRSEGEGMVVGWGLSGGGEGGPVEMRGSGWVREVPVREDYGRGVQVYVYEELKLLLKCKTKSGVRSEVGEGVGW